MTTQFSGAFEGRVVNGRGVGLADVPISNGERIVLSDQHGRFRLGVAPERHTHVFVTVPSGFATVDGFARSLDEWCGGKRTFQLRRRRHGKHVRFAAVTDPHYGQLPPRGAGATRRLGRDLARVGASVPGARFIIVAGDLTESGDPRDLRTVRRLFRASDLPVFTVFGNHDGVPKSERDGTPKPWAHRYLEVMGPLWYSFDWGGFHFAIDVNADLYFDPPMLEAKRRWLRADLRLATRRGLERIVVAHFPPTLSDARQLARSGVRLFLCGHFHCFRTYRLGPLRVLGFPSMMRGGIDMMPRGFLDVHARTGRDVAYAYKPLGPAFERPARIVKRGVIWSRRPSHYFHRAAPVLHPDGRLYVAGSDDLRGGGGHVHCLDADTGATVWSAPTQEAVKNTTALDGDRVFTVTQQGTLICHGARSGRRRWTRRLAQWPDRWINTPPVVAGDVVIAGHDRGGLEAFGVTDGRRRWHRGADQAPFVNSNGDVWPAYRTPVACGDRVVIACQSRQVLCVSSASGRPCWSLPFAYGYYSPGPIVSGGSVWVPNGQPGEPLLRIDVATGQVVARATCGGVPVSWTAHERALYIVVLDRWIDGKGWLQCRSAASGRLRWQRLLGRDPTHAYAYYAEDGPNCQAPPVVHDGQVVVACTDGNLHVFDPATGRRQRRRIPLGSPAYTAPVFDGHRLWIALWSGNLVCRSWPGR